MRPEGAFSTPGRRSAGLRKPTRRAPDPARPAHPVWTPRSGAGGFCSGWRRPERGGVRGTSGGSREAVRRGKGREGRAVLLSAPRLSLGGGRQSSPPSLLRSELPGLPARPGPRPGLPERPRPRAAPRRLPQWRATQPLRPRASGWRQLGASGPAQGTIPDSAGLADGSSVGRKRGQKSRRKRARGSGSTVSSAAST